MNQWLTESEKLIKNEDKIGSDIEVLQEQIKDNQVGFKSLYHENRKCSQLELGSQLEAVVYSTVLHPTLSIVRRTYVAFIRSFKKLLRLRRGQRRLKNHLYFTYESRDILKSVVKTIMKLNLHGHGDKFEIKI